MDLTFDRLALLAALGPLKPDAPAARIKPILGCLLVEAAALAGPVTIAIFGRDHSIILTLPAEVTSPGRELVSHDLLIRAARAATGPEVRIRPSPRQGLFQGAAAARPFLALVTGPARYEFRVDDPDLFPAPLESPPVALRLAGAELARLLGDTCAACDAEATRYALGGVLLERDGDRLRAVATDGRHLLTRTAPADWVADDSGPAAPVVPRAGCRLVADRARDDESTWEVGMDPHAASFRTDRFVLTTRLVEGRFPRWRAVFPTAPPLATVRFAAVGPLRQAARQAAVCTGTEYESTWLDLTFAPGRPVAIYAAAPDVGEAWAEAYPPPESHEGDTVSIALMLDYLLGALTPLADDAPLELRLYGPRFPAVIEAGSYRAAVMPVTSDRPVPARPGPAPAEPEEVLA